MWWCDVQLSSRLAAGDLEYTYTPGVQLSTWLAAGHLEHTYNPGVQLSTWLAAGHFLEDTYIHSRCPAEYVASGWTPGA